jgi:nucleoside phosphorylase
LELTVTRLRCLIVDDDGAKCTKLTSALELEVGVAGIEIQVRGSAYEATVALRADFFDLMIVDLNLPTRPGDTPMSDGGIRLLRQISRGTAGIKRPLFIVGVTAFSDLAEGALSEFRKHGWALLEYSHDSTSWEEAIVNQCKHITECKARIESHATASRADICIITAIHNVELQAVLDLPLGFTSFADAGDETRYSQGTLTAPDRPLRVVVCAATEMGNPSSAVLTTKVLSKFRPRVCVMAGICAGIDAEIGDIAIAEFSLHHESGKWKQTDEGESVFRPQPRYQAASDRILEAVRRFSVDHQEQILSLPAHWRDRRTGRNVEVRVGPVASGAAVVEDQTIVDGLLFRDRKLVALEMESYGFYLSGRHSIEPKPEFIMIKGICDKAKPPKTDDFQKYAAYLSARFIYEFLKTEVLFDGGLFSETE